MNPDPAECYEILGLSKNAALREVEKTYKRLVNKWHPDRVHGDPKLNRQHEEKTKQINSAVAILRKHLSNNHVQFSAARNDETTKRQEEEARQARAADEAKAREDARAKAEGDAKKKAERKRKAEEKERTKQYRKVFLKFHRLAKHGVAEAQYRIAMMYRDGHGCVRDKAKAFRWLRKPPRMVILDQHFILALPTHGELISTWMFLKLSSYMRPPPKRDLAMRTSNSVSCTTSESALSKNLTKQSNATATPLTKVTK